MTQHTKSWSKYTTTKSKKVTYLEYNNNLRILLTIFILSHSACLLNEVVNFVGSKKAVTELSTGCLRTMKSCYICLKQLKSFLVRKKIWHSVYIQHIILEQIPKIPKCSILNVNYGKCNVIFLTMSLDDFE